MLIRWAPAALYAVTAVLTGYSALYQMLQTINGGPWSWWFPIMLGASILLLIGSFHNVAPLVRPVWLAVIAAAIPLAICSVFGSLPLRCWVFALAVATLAWASLAVTTSVQNVSLTAFIASLMLAVSWLPVSFHTFHIYFSPYPPNADPIALLPLLILWSLITVCLVLSGKSSFRGSRV